MVRDVVTISFSQNPDFSVNTTGAYVENGVSTSFVNVTGRVVGAASLRRRKCGKR